MESSKVRQGNLKDDKQHHTRCRDDYNWIDRIRPIRDDVLKTVVLLVMP